jgi:hypothetical protein
VYAPCPDCQADITSSLRWPPNAMHDSESSRYTVSDGFMNTGDECKVNEVAGGG